MSHLLGWEDLLLLNEIDQPATYLKMMSGVWGINVQSIVEIGVYRGRTSKQLRLLFPEANLYLVDPWDLYEDYLSKEAGPVSRAADVYANAYEHVQEMFRDDPQVKIIRKPSTQALHDVPDGIDLIFIDGNHSYAYVKEDIEGWLPKIRKGGMMSGHDYDPAFPGVVQAVDECFPEGVVYGHNYTWLKHKDF